MADLQLKQVIQWIQAGAPHSKDIRATLFKLLYRSATLDPSSLKVRKSIDAPDTKIVVEGTLQYSAPNIEALKKKKLVLERQSKLVRLTLEPKIDGRVFITHSRTMYALSLEELLTLWNLYLIFADNSKNKLFQTLIQEEI